MSRKLKKECFVRTKFIYTKDESGRKNYADTPESKLLQCIYRELLSDSRHSDALMQSDTYKKIFGEKKKETNPSKRYIKIKSKATGKSVYRRWYSRTTDELANGIEIKNTIYVDNDARFLLAAGEENEEFQIPLEISKSCSLMFYLFNRNHYVAISLIIALVSVIFGIFSLVSPFFIHR